MGDISALAANLNELDVLQPIVVRPIGPDRYELVCGERRLRAAKLNGQTHILATVRHFTDSEMVRAEFSENIFHKPFTLSEAVAIKRALEPLEKAAAKERQGARTDKHPGKLPTSSNGRAADKAAKVTGLARRTLEKAEAVVDAAEAEPEKFGKLRADMDRTGKVNGPYKRLGVLKQAALIKAEPPPLPGRGPYRVIVADVPWPYEKRVEDPSHRATYDYPTMSIAAMCKMGDAVRLIAAPDSILWFWVINFYMREAYDVIAAWGFEAKTILTWVKPRAGYGDWLRGQTEHCIMAVRGKPIVTLTNESTRLDAPVRGHSEKPVEFYQLVERLCPASRYCDLFSRYQHNGKWDCHGDQAPPIQEAAE
jgi:N6-adenosine-specific RNA methylase IME4